MRKSDIRLLVLCCITALAFSACAGGGTSVAARSPSPTAGGLAQGLIGYATDKGIGVLDPATGKTTLVTPLPAGAAFRVSGPVWGPAAGVDHPVLYFTVHDDRPAEARTTAGVVPYDWLFRVDPFTGVIEPVAASQDSQSEGPIGLAANSHYLALSVGCCASYEVDAFDLTQAVPEMKVLSKPPDQTAFFTEGAVPGSSGLVAVRAFGTGAWYWLNADAGVLNPFPLKLGPDDGPIAISRDGTVAAVSLPDHGAVIEPINSSLPIVKSTPSSSAPASPSTKASPSPTAAPAAPRRLNSRLPHVDGLAFSPDGKQLVAAVNGELEIYSASGRDGDAPLKRYLAGGNVTAVDWSDAIHDKPAAVLKASASPRALVDGLLGATRLPATADTPAARPLTKVYLWQYDSTKASPIASITDATPEVLAKYPPIAAGVVFHHWAPSGTWAFFGGCLRYRVVITGSVAPVATTVGLTGAAPCGKASL